MPTFHTISSRIIMTAADNDNNSVGAAGSAAAAAEKEGEGVSASTSHSNLLALLDAASRVETLPVTDGQDDKADEKMTAANLQDASKALPKTNALTAEMVRELTAQKAANLSSALDVATASAGASSSTSPIVTASNSSSTPTSSIRDSPASSSGTGSKGKLMASKKSTQSKHFKPKRPKLPCMAQPRLAGSAPTSAGSSAGTNWTVTKRNVVPPAPHADTDDDSKMKGGGGPKPLKLEPVVKDTFPIILYRVLMKGEGYDDEDEEADPSSASASAAGENPSEQPSTSTTAATATKTKTKGYQDIVHWLPEGTHFVIVDTDRFRTEVMPKEFGVSQKLTSFTRRLSRWGFQQVRVPGYAQHMVSIYVQVQHACTEIIVLAYPPNRSSHKFLSTYAILIISNPISGLLPSQVPAR